MAKKKGRRALFNLLQKLPAKFWTKGRLFYEDEEGNQFFCNMGFVAAQLAKRPIDDEQEALAVVQQAFDIDEETQAAIENINDGVDSYSQNIIALESFLLKGTEPGVAVGLAKGITVEPNPAMGDDERCSNPDCRSCYRKVD